jgi:hypothetical protein
LLVKIVTGLERGQVFFGGENGCSVAASRQSAANSRRNFKRRLSPGSRYAEEHRHLVFGQRCPAEMPLHLQNMLIAQILAHEF